MKYTDRTKTPLKWHHFLEYFLIPVIAVSSLYNLFSLINELFGLQMPYARNILRPILQVFGATVSNLGGCFWYVIGYFGVRLLLAVLIVYVCVGFFQWKNNARKGWLYYLLIQAVEAGLLCIGCFMIYLSSPALCSEILSAVLVSSYSVSASFSETVLLVALIFDLILALIIWILNAIYYSKRSQLFVDTYVPYQEEGQPAEAQTAPVQEEPAPAAAQTVSEDTMHAADETEHAETAEESKEEPAAESAGEEPVKEEPKATAEADKTEDEPKDGLRFCPNCGAELGENDQAFCTHCGAKLK
jgi:hypothetical protein